MRQALCRNIALLAAMLAIGSPAGATTARQLTNAELAVTADIIAIGRCTGVRSEWEGRSLVTVATVEVQETLKGSARKRISVVLPGGVDARRRIPVAMTWPGAPTLAVGEEALLFLVSDRSTSRGPIISGFSQGKFSIGRDAAGRRFVTRDLTGVTLQNGAGVTRGTRSRQPLDQFKAEIAGHLQ
jgi:hypothetical protein